MRLSWRVTALITDRGRFGLDRKIPRLRLLFRSLFSIFDRVYKVGDVAGFQLASW